MASCVLVQKVKCWRKKIMLISAPGVAVNPLPSSFGSTWVPLGRRKQDIEVYGPHISKFSSEDFPPVPSSCTVSRRPSWALSPWPGRMIVFLLYHPDAFTQRKTLPLRFGLIHPLPPPVGHPLPLTWAPTLQPYLVPQAWKF